MLARPQGHSDVVLPVLSPAYLPEVIPKTFAPVRASPDAAADHVAPLAPGC